MQKQPMSAMESRQKKPNERLRAIEWQINSNRVDLVENKSKNILISKFGMEL